jgi:hypothetical protein
MCSLYVYTKSVMFVLCTMQLSVAVVLWTRFLILLFVVKATLNFVPLNKFVVVDVCVVELLCQCEHSFLLELSAYCWFAS